MTQSNLSSWPSIRLYVAQTLSPGALLSLDEARSHYVRNVMRRNDGDKIAAFNGEDGEWEATLHHSGKRGVSLSLGRQLSQARPCPDIWLAFALVKNKSESIVEKATELGVREIHAVVTQHAVVKAANLDKLQAHAIEAAEQCERHDVPSIITHKNLGLLLGEWPKERTLYYGDESGKGAPLPALDISMPCGVLIGPEGGFSADEHAMLHAAPFAKGFGMGPRILRADTAAIASLACLMAKSGNWQEAPHFKAQHKVTA